MSWVLWVDNLLAMEWGSCPEWAAAQTSLSPYFVFLTMWCCFSWKHKNFTDQNTFLSLFWACNKLYPTYTLSLISWYSKWVYMLKSNSSCSSNWSFKGCFCLTWISVPITVTWLNPTWSFLYHAQFLLFLLNCVCAHFLLLCSLFHFIVCLEDGVDSNHTTVWVLCYGQVFSARHQFITTFEYSLT